jgi:hypothetical protein
VVVVAQRPMVVWMGLQWGLMGEQKVPVVLAEAVAEAPAGGVVGGRHIEAREPVKEKILAQ